MGRPALPFLIGVPAVVLLVLTGASIFQLAQVKGQLNEKQQAIQGLTAQNDTLQQQLRSLQSERQGLEERLGSVRTQLTSATEDLERVRSSVAELQTRYGTLKEQNGALEQQVSQMTTERDEAAQRIQSLEQDNTDVERARERLRERLAFLDQDYQRLSQQLAILTLYRGMHADSSTASASSQTPGASSQAQAVPAPSKASSASDAFAVLTPPDLSLAQTVELPPIVVRKAHSENGPPVRARLLEVNAAHRFVVLDQGSEGGVWAGMAFDLLRAGAKIGRAVAVRVKPRLSACDVVASSEQGLPQVGDLAVQQRP